MTTRHLLIPPDELGNYPASRVYVIVPNWWEYQHYQDGRAPSWIKCYIELLHDDRYTDLSMATRGWLHAVWMLAAENTKVPGCIRLDAVLRHKCMRKVHALRHIESLNHAGFLLFSSRAEEIRLEKKKEERGKSGENRSRSTRKSDPKTRSENAQNAAAYRPADENLAPANDPVPVSDGVAQMLAMLKNRGEAA